MDSHPVTPLRSPQMAQVHDSPFSDYYTDSSTDSSPSLTLGQQKVVSRLTTVGSKALRNEPSKHAYDLLHKSIDSMEEALSEIESQSKQTADIGDSGLFMGDEEPLSPHFIVESFSKKDTTRSTATSNGIDSVIGDDSSQESNPDYAALLQQCSTLLHRVTRSATRLRLRLSEVKHTNDVMILSMSQASHENLTLRSENEALKQDINFDHSELLFLKLQLKALELQAQPWAEMHGDKDLAEDIERWKGDWHDVENRLRGRRTGHANQLRGKEWEYQEQKREKGEWKLSEWQKTVNGTQTITIRRTNKCQDKDGLAHKKDITEVTQLGSNGAVEGSGKEEKPEKVTTVTFDKSGDETAKTNDVEVKNSKNDVECEVTTIHKTAGQELWEGLMALAGIHDV
ncbi:MAG: hypothetical protein M1820_009242 [Bogoriella megaspora]|nr:MAG: hypothetical protein M1820_009242 [Bogoriella megaspora]